MKKGDKAKIYHDPFTRACTEGEAVLVKFFKPAGYYGGEKYEMWEVKFFGDDHTAIRKLSVKDIKRP